MTNEKLLEVAVQAANAAASILRGGFGTVFDIRSKTGRQNLVTEYDVLCEQTIKDILQNATPGSAFLGEESGYHQGTGLTWVVDPLDGTVNFAHGIPIFSVSIAAVVDNEPVCGVVLHPLLQETFTATKGGGAWLNGRRLQVSSIVTLEESLLVTGFPYNAFENPGRCIDQFGDMIRMGIPVRRLGSAALDLAYVAAGRFDGYWEVALEPWDMAAGVLLVREAGGIVTQYNNVPWAVAPSSIVAANPFVHSRILEII